MSDDKDLEQGREDNVGSEDENSGSSHAPGEAGTDPRGFASMDEQKQRQIASKGGKAAHEKGTAHEFTPEEARAAGRKGGEVVSQNRSHMAEIGRKGGQRVSQNRAHMANIGRKGGEAVSGDRAHMAQIGRKGGESRGERQQRQKSSPPPQQQPQQEAPRNDNTSLKKTG
jgi:hypothetical protein